MHTEDTGSDGGTESGSFRGRTHGCSDGLGTQGHGDGKVQRAAAFEWREALGKHQGLRCCSARDDGTGIDAELGQGYPHGQGCSHGQEEGLSLCHP